MTEVETFLRAVSERLAELEAKVARSESTSAPNKDRLRADAERLARIADVELAAGRRASFDSRITLDALQDAQAELVARVESTAKDLHESLERDGRVSSARHRSGSAWRSTSPPSTDQAAAAPSTGSAATTPVVDPEPVAAATPVAEPEPVAATPVAATPIAEPEPVAATAPVVEPEPVAATPVADPEPRGAASPTATTEPAAAAQSAAPISAAATAPATTPAPAHKTAPPTDLAAVLAELDSDPLGDASNALDGVLDDVMGSLRSKD